MWVLEFCFWLVELVLFFGVYVGGWVCVLIVEI